MASGDVTLAVGTQIRFFTTATFSPADAATNYTIGTPTDVAMALSAVADDAARQSAKVDLGATRAEAYQVMAAFDYTGETPTAGEAVHLYWAPSTSTTQANGNVWGNSGADAACPDGAVGSPTIAEFIRQCQWIGTFTTTDDAGVQAGEVNPRFQPGSRYGQMIVYNQGGDVFEADNVEAHVVMNPILRNVE